MFRYEKTVPGRQRSPVIVVGMLVVILWTGWLPTAAEAGRWMYRRSYYSHPPPPGYPGLDLPRPTSRSAYRPAVVGGGYGVAARGGYRRNRIFLRSGQSSDLTIIYEDWFDVRAWP